VSSSAATVLHHKDLRNAGEEWDDLAQCSELLIGKPALCFLVQLVACVVPSVKCIGSAI
jgi:hypothetical protein